MLALAATSFCPRCATALEARDLVMSNSFWTHAGLAVLPVLATLAIVYVFVRGLDRGRHG